MLAELTAGLADELESRLGPLLERPTPPALLDRRGLAGALNVGVDTVDRLRSEGCPELRVGDVPRFELERVLDWLRDRSRSNSKH